MLLVVEWMCPSEVGQFSWRGGDGFGEGDEQDGESFVRIQVFANGLGIV